MKSSMQWIVLLLGVMCFQQKYLVDFVQRSNELFLHQHYGTGHPVTVILCCGACEKLNFVDLAFCTGFWSRVSGFMGDNDSNAVIGPLVKVSVM
jgi:hypothetical protein